MPRRRRSRLETVADILQILASGCRPPTRLAADTNLACDRMAKLVAALLDKGVVKENDGKICITPEGLKMLEAYRQWRRFLDALGL
jgi:predicted transcriptional regulator